MPSDDKFMSDYTKGVDSMDSSTDVPNSAASTSLTDSNLDLNSKISPVNSPPHHPTESRNVRDEYFWIEDKMVVFKAENTLFRVHRHFLTEQSGFFSMLSQFDTEGQGDTEENPIELPDVKAQEFRALLGYIYKRHEFPAFIKAMASKNLGISLHSAPDSDPLSKEAAAALKEREAGLLEEKLKILIDLLSIATRYDFERVRDHAIKTIEKLWVTERQSFDWVPAPGSKSVSPVKRMALGMQFHVRHWVVAACESLVFRGTGIQPDEAEEIGHQLAYRIMHAREKFRKQLLGTMGTHSKDVLDEVVKEALAPIQGIPEPAGSSSSSNRNNKTPGGRRRISGAASAVSPLMSVEELMAAAGLNLFNFSASTALNAPPG